MTEQHESLDGVVVVDCDGKEVGEILEVHRDAFSGRPAWVAVRGGLLRGKSLVPVGDNKAVDGKLQVPYDSATIRKAPYVDLTVAEQALEVEASREGFDESIQDDKTVHRAHRDDHWELYEYYGLPFGRPDTTGAASPEADYGFGSAGTSPEAEGAQATPEEIVATHPEAAEAYPEGILGDESAATSTIGGGPGAGGPSAGDPSEPTSESASGVAHHVSGGGATRADAGTDPTR